MRMRADTRSKILGIFDLQVAISLQYWTLHRSDVLGQNPAEFPLSQKALVPTFADVIDKSQKLAAPTVRLGSRSRAVPLRLRQWVTH